MQRNNVRFLPKTATYTLLHELACNIASENAAYEGNNHDVHANECNKTFIIHYHNTIVSLPTKSSSNLPFKYINSNQAHRGC